MVRFPPNGIHVAFSFCRRSPWLRDTSTQRSVCFHSRQTLPERFQMNMNTRIAGLRTLHGPWPRISRGVLRDGFFYDYSSRSSVRLAKVSVAITFLFAVYTILFVDSLYLYSTFVWTTHSYEFSNVLVLHDVNCFLSTSPLSICRVNISYITTSATPFGYEFHHFHRIRRNPPVINYTLRPFHTKSAASLSNKFGIGPHQCQIHHPPNDHGPLFFSLLTYICFLICVFGSSAT